MKHILREFVKPFQPDAIRDRQDKMGFPTPLSEWLSGEARDFVRDIFLSQKALNRDLVDNRQVLHGVDNEPRYGRKVWGLLCIEIWQQEFHDRESEYKKMTALAAV